MASKKRKLVTDGEATVHPKKSKLVHLPAPGHVEDERPLKSFQFHLLPHRAKKKIYTYLGLIRSCPIHLHNPSLGMNLDWNSDEKEIFYDDSEKSVAERANSNRKRTPRYPLFKNTSCMIPSVDSWYGPNYQDPTDTKCCNCMPIPTLLFEVSKAAGDDAQFYFYKYNNFRILKRLDLGLEKLKRLSANALQKMGRLHIDLGLVTNSDFRKKHAMLPLLRELSSFLTTKANRSRLSLTLECNISGLRAQSREMFTDSLYPVTGLKQCVVSLDRDSPSYLYYLNPKTEKGRTFYGDIAQSLVSRMTSNGSENDSGRPFRYADLPKELREMVLYHTNLVISEKEKCRHNQYSIKDNRLHRDGNCCGNCNPIVHYGSYNYDGPCFCFGSKSAASSACTCDKAPKALFLVNKLMRAEAREVLLKHNQFFVSGQPTSAVKFFRSSPKDIVHNMRYLEFSYDPWRIGYAPMWVHSTMTILDTFWDEFALALNYLELHGVFRSMEVTLTLPPPSIHHKCGGHGSLVYLPDLVGKLSLLADCIKRLKTFSVGLGCSCLNEQKLEQVIPGRWRKTSAKLSRNTQYTWSKA